MSLRRPNCFFTAMKVRPLLACLATTCAAVAQDSFPGLQSVLSPAEWKRSGLDRLSPDQIGVIDAALIRYHLARQTVATAAATIPVPSSPDAPASASPAEAAVIRSRYWEKFGLQKITGDWRSQPPMKAKVTAWQGSNRFVLDTGQVWEGQEAIPFELLGQEITIEARPLGAFALRLNENSMTVRVRRLH
jgi:hypothetical protein